MGYGLVLSEFQSTISTLPSHQSNTVNPVKVFVCLNVVGVNLNPALNSLEVLDMSWVKGDCTRLK